MTDKVDTSLEVEHLRTVGQIVSSFLERTSVPATELPALIRSVRDALGAGSPAPKAEPEMATTAEAPSEPAVPVRRSIRPDHLVCLVCGAQQKTLKRHLQVAHGLTAEAYRAMWQLPRDYPMIASDYAARRSELAKRIGLGRRRTEEAPAVAAAAAPTPARRSRRKAE